MTDNEDIIKELKKIQYLLVGVLLNKKTDLKGAAKVIKVSDKTLTKLYPERISRSKLKKLG